ncbi:MAG: cell division protein FtsZ [Thermoleophilaceae bacterium]|nr:cell division protein FtsZ [Thermoleophilaceae bacterium]
MDRGKRASMREGPLAALFRRTEEEGIGDTPAPRQEPPSEERPAPERTEELRPAPPSARTPRTEDVPERRPIPTPEERLKAVFSADIPENILDRPSASPAPVSGWDPASDPSRGPVLRVVGVGGAGVNAVNRMIEAGVEGVDFIAVNTDAQSLQASEAPERVHIGAEVTRGLGAGANPELGRQSALEDYDRLKSLLKGADMIFIAAGAGGGTGTGAAPVIARIAREVGALTVGIVTKPFSFEGSRRAAQAEKGVEDLAREVDTLITIPNSRLLTVLDRQTSMVEAFRVADDVLRQGVQGISDLVTLPGLINLDFADVRTIMSQAGQALLGIGMATGEQRAIEAAQRAVESPLLETSVDGARSILLSITGGRDLSLWEVNEAAKAVAQAAHPDANIIFGAMVDEKVVDQVWVTVVATGYGDRQPRPSRPAAESAERLERPVRDAREADHEPRVIRTRDNALSELDIPEFVPRG